MWFDTLVLQLRLHMAYRVNGILYRLRFLSLSYESGFAKTLGLVLAILRELLGLLLGKLLYMAAFFACPPAAVPVRTACGAVRPPAAVSDAYRRHFQQQAPGRGAGRLLRRVSSADGCPALCSVGHTGIRC